MTLPKSFETRRIGILILGACFLTNVFAQPNVFSNHSFGIHVHDLSNLEDTKEISFGSLRLWDSHTSWRDVQSQPKRFKLDTLAAAINKAELLGLSVTLTLGSSPSWASARPGERCAYGFGCAAEPANLADWRRYVQVVANTFRGKIECYEPWNEASFPTDPVFLNNGDGGEPNHFFSGSVSSLVAISKVAHEEIKRADPKACVLSPSMHSSGDWIKKLDQYLNMGGGKYMDALSFHFYFGNEPEEALRNIRAVRAVMNKHNLSTTPIWNTEVGIPFLKIAKRYSGISYDDLVFSLVLRTYLVNFTGGVSRVYWYAWDDGEFGLSPQTANGSAGGDAIAAALKLIGKMPEVKCASDRGLWRCDIKNGATSIQATWVTKEVSASAPRKIRLNRDGKRWGREMETLSAGTEVTLDARPVLVWTTTNSSGTKKP